MINKEFTKNWGKFIDLSSKISIITNPMDIEDKLRIPLTPIDINSYLLFYIFQEIYPKFINDQLNVIDLIISDYEIENIVLAAYSYQMIKPGVHETINPINKNDLKLKLKDLNNQEQLFNQIQFVLSNKYAFKASHVRIIKKRGIDLINRHMESLAKFTLSELIKSLLDLIQILITNNLLIIYPEPPVLTFLKNSLFIMKNLKLSQIFHYFIELLPSVNISLILQTPVSPILITSNYYTPKSESKEIDILVQWIKLQENQNLDLEKKMLDLNNDYIITLPFNLLINYLLDIFETPSPIVREKTKLLLQKLLFGIRSFRTHWNISPKPILTNFIMRFILKVIGIDLNLYKLSHWAIPELIFNLIDPYSGMLGKTLLLLTDFQSKPPHKAQLILIGFENGTIVNIQKLELESIAIESNLDNLNILKLEVSKLIGTINLIVKIDKKLLQYLVETMVNLPKLNFLKILKILKLLKNQKYFEIYPPIPIYTLIKSKRSFGLAKNFLSILIDKHNF